jgi:hypothetical protein
MSRLDVNQLSVPAEFAAIFERREAPAAKMTVDSIARSPEASPPAEAATSQPPASPQPSATLLDALATNGVRAAGNGQCPKCNNVTSAVEAKMGRCLTCGTSFAGGTVSVGI